MADLLWLTRAQLPRIAPFFPLVLLARSALCRRQPSPTGTERWYHSNGLEGYKFSSGFKNTCISLTIWYMSTIVSVWSC
jgi:hypothetical protein